MAKEDEKKEAAREFITRKAIHRREGDQLAHYPANHPIKNIGGADELDEWRKHAAVWDSIDDRNELERASEGIVSRGPKGLKVEYKQLRKPVATRRDDLL